MRTQQKKKKKKGAASAEASTPDYPPKDTPKEGKSKGKKVPKKDEFDLALEQMATKYGGCCPKICRCSYLYI